MPLASNSAIIRYGFAYVEGGEVQALAPVLLGADEAAAAHQVGLGEIAELLDYGDQINAVEHDRSLSLYLQPEITGQPTLAVLIRK